MTDARLTFAHPPPVSSVHFRAGVLRPHVLTNQIRLRGDARGGNASMERSPMKISLTVERMPLGNRIASPTLNTPATRPRTAKSRASSVWGRITYCRGSDNLAGFGRYQHALPPRPVVYHYRTKECWRMVRRRCS